MLDCLVVGAGHAGLMCGYLLDRSSLSYLVVDGAARFGDVWRQRPRNLTLFTSRQFCRLADLTMPGDPNGFPRGHEFADHVERFAREKALPVALGRRVIRLRADGTGFSAKTADGQTITAKTVINSTGSNQQPIVPDFSASLAPTVSQIVAPMFRDAGSVSPDGPVVVVGDGASGRQIAQELAPTHRVTIARGRKRKLVANRILGRDVFWWLNGLGILHADRDSSIAKILRKRDPTPCASASDNQLAALGVTLKPRAVDAEKDCVGFADGSREPASTVIWCGGYREDLSWVDLPALQAQPAFSHRQGRTAQDRFFVVGRKWLTCRASELVLGIERDARMVVNHVVAAVHENATARPRRC